MAHLPATRLERYSAFVMPIVLPDLVSSKSKLVICGTAAGTHSARTGRYYAGRGNKLWSVLYEFGATPYLLSPAEFAMLPQFGIGFTDLAKEAVGMDKEVGKGAFGAKRLEALIQRTQPVVLVFNGKRAAQIFFNSKAIQYGYQHGKDIGETRVFVAPSTSGTACRWWNDALWQTVLSEAGVSH